MEQDIFGADWLCQKILADTEYAQEFYAALCNNVFHKQKENPDALFSFSWRHAGYVVATVRRQGDYLDWHCSGFWPTNVREGAVTVDVAEDIQRLGWEVWTEIIKDHILKADLESHGLDPE